MERSTYYSDAVASMIYPGCHDDESVANRVGFLISAASMLAGQSCPALTIGEWCTLAEANNDTWHTYSNGVERTLHGLWHSVFDRAYECNERWSVDCEALAVRLSNMPLAEQLSVFEIARRFWIAEESVVGETFAQKFTRLGAPGLS